MKVVLAQIEGCIKLNNKEIKAKISKLVQKDAKIVAKKI